MSHSLLVIFTILLCAWACYCFYLVGKRYKETDDSFFSFIDPPIIVALVIKLLSWLAEKFLPKVPRIILFKISCFVWALLLLLIASALWTL